MKAPAQYRFQREISLLGATVSGVRDEEGGLSHLLAVRAPKLTFVLQASSPADKAAWIKVRERRTKERTKELISKCRGWCL